MKYSPLQHVRYKFLPVLPLLLQKEISTISPEFGKNTESLGDHAKLKEIFDKTYGRRTVRFSTGESQQKTTPSISASYSPAARLPAVIMS